MTCVELRLQGICLLQLTQWLTWHALIYYILCYNGTQADLKHAV